MTETTKDIIIRLAKEKKYNSITDFINSWIQSGETFKSLEDLLKLEYGIRCAHSGNVWKIARNYLTIPYESDDQFWYKWDAIARAKNFKDVQDMLQDFKNRNLHVTELAIELGCSSSTIVPLLRRLSRNRVKGQISSKRTYIKRSPFHKDRDGFCHKSARDRWCSKLEEYGFRSLKDAVWRLRKKGLACKDMAKLFGVTKDDFQYRLRRAKIRIMKRKTKVSHSNNETKSKNSKNDCS
jgi:hypothetical protein